MAEPPADRPRLDDEAVYERLARLEALLARVEALPGPSGELALDAVCALAEVYGEALARAVGYASEVPGLVEAVTGDELLGHLLVLHGIHPDPVEARVAEAIDELRPAVAERGGELELVGVEQHVALVRMSLPGCGSSSTGMEEAIRLSVLAVAPELTEVRRVSEPVEPAFVSMDSLLQRPAGPRAGR